MRRIPIGTPLSMGAALLLAGGLAAGCSGSGGSSGSAQGGSGYRKNSSDAPIVRARLFFQNERAWLPVTAAVPPVGVT